MEGKMEMTEEGQTLPVVSIIVPVYNVKSYVGECVESLCRQTYTNLEILLVDDGSTDGSGEVCDEYAGRDERIRVIHQANRGLSGARNMGLDDARGEYIAFVDSDDLVSRNYVETLYELLMKYEADIAACAYIKGTTEQLTDIREKVLSLDNVKEICMPSVKLLKQWHGKYKQQETVAWNKLYCREVWNGRKKIRFPESRNHEDVLISHLVVQGAKTIVLTTEILYFYRIRKGSITLPTEYDREKVWQNLRAQRERMEFFRAHRYWRAYFNLLKGYVLHVLWFWWRRV